MRWLFWLSSLGVLYPYFGYPIVLRYLARRSRRRADAAPDPLPSITLIIPVHNEARRIVAKVRNTLGLEYPNARLEIIFVSDGSTDATVSLIREHAGMAMDVIELPARGGKAAALNAGLARATNDIVVFSDASILLNSDALIAIVRPFADPTVGCVSGEDRIADADGEGLYGRYELALRRLESEAHSIVGASGSFYAQRRALCAPFVEGLAPDFLSVLRTVELGYRALAEPRAVGSMTSVKDPRHEFERKVRTVIRGITTLSAFVHLLNPRRFGRFAILLASHKLLRWTVPFCLIGVLIASAALAGSLFFRAVFAAQVTVYLLASVCVRWPRVCRFALGRVAVYLVLSNLAILVAWVRFHRGVRQEVWTPSHR